MSNLLSSSTATHYPVCLQLASNWHHLWGHHLDYYSANSPPPSFVSILHPRQGPQPQPELKITSSSLESCRVSRLLKTPEESLTEKSVRPGFSKWGLAYNNVTLKHLCCCIYLDFLLSEALKFHSIFLRKWNITQWFPVWRDFWKNLVILAKCLTAKGLSSCL